MVISGGNFKPDTLKPKEVVSLLLDDEEIEMKCKYDVQINQNLIYKNYLFLWLQIDRRPSCRIMGRQPIRPRPAQQQLQVEQPQQHRL